MGHPDKLCDQIADAILDECIRVDKNAEVRVNAVSKTKLVNISVINVHLGCFDG